MLLLFVGGSVSFVAAGDTSGGRPYLQTTILARELTLSGADFSSGGSRGPVRKDDGLALTQPATAVYTSPVILSPLPFSDLGTLWEAQLPTGSSLEIEVRSSPDAEGERWSAWQRIVEDDDQPLLPAGQYGGSLLAVPQREGVHQRLQFRLTLSAGESESLPTVSRLTFTFIDARAGPTTSEIVARQRAYRGLFAVVRPPVITRNEWGCPEGESSPSWPPEYARVTHVIIHHTATPNDDTDWAARVRAIWYYHAITRGWGDIGYNFLVDPQGNVYEGRAGGNDVVGGHARSYNYGTMGVGNLGTYTEAPVPAPLQQSLESLIAWKASQRGIDPLGRSFNSLKVYDHIAGHRDVGLTTCPGDVLYNLIPTIRQNVDNLLAQQEEQVVVDELDPAFSPSAAYWHDGCGRAEHSWWTHSVTNPAESTNWGIWRPDLPESGWYEIFAYIPSCADDLPDYTESAHYRVYYRDGGTTVTVNQKAEQGRWVSLGTYPFYPGAFGYVYLDDLTDDYWRSVWYDQVRWVLRSPLTEPPAPPWLQAPADGAWADSRQVTLSWIVPATQTVDGLNLVVATDPLLTDRLVDDALAVTPHHPLSLSQDYPALYWTVRAHNVNGYGPFAPVRRFGVDTEPPASHITALYRTVDGVYLLSWSGTDTGSGIATYTVQAYDGPESPWRDLWTETTQTSGVVEVPAEGIRYFRVHARDLLGHEEPPHEGSGDLSSAEVTLLSRSWFEPLLLRGVVVPTPWPRPTPAPSPLPTAGPTLPATATPTPAATEPPASSPTPSATPGPTPTVVPTPPVSPTSTPGPLPTPTAVPTPPVAPTATPTLPSPTPTRMPSPTPAAIPGGLGWLPDLQVVAVRSSQNSPFDCGRPTGIAVEILNLGMAPSGPFSLSLTGNGVDCRWLLEELRPAEHALEVCPEIVLNTVVTATVDVENTVIEEDEGNNALRAVVSVLVLPPCPPGP